MAKVSAAQAKARKKMASKMKEAAALHKKTGKKMTDCVKAVWKK